MPVQKRFLFYEVRRRWEYRVVLYLLEGREFLIFKYGELNIFT